MQMINTDLLSPVIALVAWSMVMWVWLYVTRIPAIIAANMTLDPNQPNGQQMALLPAKVRWKADNYNHLMEQPTIFYALVISLALLADTTLFTLIMAWAYVILRVIHSLYQALFNRIEIRFGLFMLSNVPLLGLTFQAIKAVL
jgi:hypothetical protein